MDKGWTRQLELERRQRVFPSTLVVLRNPYRSTAPSLFFNILAVLPNFPPCSSTHAVPKYPCQDQELAPCLATRVRT